jgi:ribose transport system substrate-binding protein
VRVGRYSIDRKFHPIYSPGVTVRGRRSSTWRTGGGRGRRGSGTGEATSLGPAISYASAHHVQLISVDTVVGVGKVYMVVVRASNLLYGLDACAYISSRVKSGYVLDLEGDLTSSNGAGRPNAFDACMQANDPGVTVLKKPTVWTDPTAVTDAQDAVNAYGSQLKAIYSQ